MIRERKIYTSKVPGIASENVRIASENVRIAIAIDVTAEDPKQFFQMFDIYSGNVVCEGYREIFSSCEDIDA